MATSVKQPVGGRRRRRTSVVQLTVGAAPRVVPDPPADLAPGDAVLWRELWGEPVAAGWRPADGALVRRLIQLRARVAREGDAAPVALYGATLALESSLLLTPRARAGRAAPAEPPPVVGEPTRRMPARERDRLLRG